MMRQESEESFNRGCDERDWGLGEKIEFDIFVRSSLAARARVKISEGVRSSTLLASRAKRGFLICRPLPCFHPRFQSRGVKGDGTRRLPERGGERRGRGGDEDENAENERNAKCQLRLRDLSPRSAREKVVGERPRRETRD